MNQLQPDTAHSGEEPIRAGYLQILICDWLPIEMILSKGSRPSWSNSYLGPIVKTLPLMSSLKCTDLKVVPD